MKFDQLCRLTEMVDDDIRDLDQDLDQDLDSQEGIIDADDTEPIDSVVTPPPPSKYDKIDDTTRHFDIYMKCQNDIIEILKHNNGKLRKGLLIGELVRNNPDVPITVLRYVIRILTTGDNPKVIERFNNHGTVIYELNLDFSTNEPDETTFPDIEDEAQIIDDMIHNMEFFKGLSADKAPPDTFLDDEEDKPEVEEEDLYRRPSWYPKADED